MESGTFGYWVRRQRMSLDLTQAALAHRVGCAKITIKKIERSERRPSRTMAARLAESLDIPEVERETFVLCAIGEASLSRLTQPIGVASYSPQRQLPQTQDQNDSAVKTEERPLFWSVAPQPKHNLPAQLTSFIGREKEIAAIKQAIADHRLVTLTGSGGVGKTRLSNQVAADLLDWFPGGIWFVELAPVSDPELIPQTILSAAEMQTQQGKTPLESLEVFLSEKTTLLVLDNCEHLVGACAQLSERLLKVAPNLKILASSREPLGVRGEKIWYVQSLSIPVNEQSLSIEQHHKYEAVRLFIDRARLVQPDFALTDENAAAVAGICQQLDGIPLAIELAAARMRVLNTEQIASRLNERFLLLTSGSRSDLPRHQTLKALIDWSYVLLSKNERLLLQRLSVFVGGWTLEAAERVCVGSESKDLAPTEVLDLISQLVDKSMVLAERQEGGERRYRLLESVRQYAHEKLVEAGEVYTMRDRHLAYYLELAEVSAPKLKNREQVSARNHLRSELDNLRLAMEWALKKKQSSKMLRMVHALHRFWLISRRNTEGIHWAKEALILAEDIAEYKRSPLRAWGLLSLGRLSVQVMEKLEDAQTMLVEAETIFRDNGDLSGTAHALVEQGYFGLMQGKQLETQPLLKECLEIARDLGDRWLVGKCLLELGFIERIQEDYQRGKELFEESVTILLEIGDIWEIVRPYNELAYYFFFQGEIVRACRMLEEKLIDVQEVGKGRMFTRMISFLVLFYAYLGDFTQARLLAEKSLEIAFESKNAPSLAYALMHVGTMSYLENDLELAHAQLEQSLQISENANILGLSVQIMEILGRVYTRQGKIRQAVAILEKSLAISREKYNADRIANALRSLGDALRTQGDLERASSCYKESMELHYKIGFQVRIPVLLEAFAKIAVLQGLEERAARLFGAANVSRDRFEIPIPPVDVWEYEASIATLCNSLGEACLEKLLQEGRAIPLDEAVTYALKTDGE